MWISKLRPDSDALFEEKVNFMRLLSFYAGILQFVISFFHLGIIFNWLPDYFISAFISGVSFHVITSQVFHMFGIDKISKTGPFGMFHYWYQVGANIQSSNLTSGTFSLCFKPWNSRFQFSINFSFGGVAMFGHLDNNKSVVKEICQATEKHSHSRRASHCFHNYLDLQLPSTW